MNLNAILKKQADALKTFLSKKNINLPITTCLHAVAVINGYKNWNTLNAVLPDKIEFPIAQESDTNQETLEDRLSNLEDKVNIIWEDFYSIAERYVVTESWVDRLRGIDRNPE